MERVNAGLDVQLSVIAPGGSVIYGEAAMNHLKEISEVVYLKMSYEEMEKRIGNVVDRGVALKPGFTLRDLYNERVPYYEKYAAMERSTSSPRFCTTPRIWSLISFCM